MTSTFDMGYHEYPPPANLGDWVECLWWRRSEGERRADRGRILPDGRIDLVWTMAAGVLVAGPQTRFLLRPFAPPFLAVGARLHPGAGAGVLGVPASDLLDTYVPLDAIDARLASVLPDRLAPAQTPVEALSAFGAVLSGRCRELDPPDPLVRAVVAALARGATRISDLARLAAISERQLERRFRADVGYGPKTLQRVMRFQRVVSGLARDVDNAGDLAARAAWAGYADQAHLTREARELSGLTPAQLVRWLRA
jgi:AraC-like DNA-binding protein